MPVDGVNSAHFAIGPVVAIVVVAVLAGVSKWIFGSGRKRTAARTLVPPGVQIDTGLLRSVAELPDRSAARPVRTMLSDAGIRSTVGVRGDGRVQVLVFPADEDRARRLVSPGSPEARPGAGSG
ncbi:MAG TPA: hypothetical protein VLM05_04485 [Mycobacteriales bacterium]|nr:hypothetical protein [Mycobacteriales bacterium]